MDVQGIIVCGKCIIKLFARKRCITIFDGFFKIGFLFGLLCGIGSISIGFCFGIGFCFYARFFISFCFLPAAAIFAFDVASSNLSCKCHIVSSNSIIKLFSTYSIITFFDGGIKFCFFLGLFSS
jgi:hypothetical protein